MKRPPTARQIDSIVGAFEDHRQHVQLFRDQLLAALTGSGELAKLVHSIDRE